MTVSAAASLNNAFDEIIKIFNKSHPDLKIHANYAASNPLLRQIVAGAPADVFASADQATMDKAAAAKAINPVSRRNFAQNDLVLIVPAGNSKPSDLTDLCQLSRIAIGNPDSVPAGRYAKAALEYAGLWDKLQPKCIQAESVRQALDYVARGEVDTGFVYGTDARHLADKVDIALVAGGHEPVSYPIAVTTAATNPEAARQFIDFVLSRQGQAILAKYGFARP